MRHVFTAALGLALALALTFLFLPLLAIFLRVSPGQIIEQLGGEVAIEALLVTLKTSLIANAVILLVGTPAAYLLATRRFPGRSLVITLVELPLVLPPAVAGIALLAAVGPSGILGGAVDAAGIELTLQTAGVVTKAPHRELARAFVEGLTRGHCADALREAGFGAAP